MRSFLARFLFSGEEVFKSVGDLSGGEKGRLALAKLIYSNFNVLVLDEPTNHLDIPSREALENALDIFEGTIITVSHDRFFLDQISTQILSFEKDGSIEIFDGNYSEFHDWKSSVALSTSSVEKQDSNFQNSESEGQKVTDGGQKTVLSKNALKKIENRIAEIELEIPESEDYLKHLSFRIATPEIAANHAKLQEATSELTRTEQKIQLLYQEWEDLLEQLNS